MVSRCRQFLLSIAVVCVSGSLLMLSPALQAAEPIASGEQIIKPEVHRRDVHLADIDTENFEIGYFAGSMSVEDFGVSTVQGVRFAYHLTEDVFIEANYGKTETGESTDERASLIPAVEDRTLTYFNVLLGYNLLPGEVYWGEDLAFNTDLYLVVGSGTTEFDGEDRSTLVYGFGYRFLASDWFSIHVDMRRHTFETDIYGAKKHRNLEYHFGLAVFF